VVKKVMWKPAGILIALSLLLCLLTVQLIQADGTKRFELGNELLQQEKFDQALVVYEAFVEQNPNHRLTGAVRWTMGNIHMRIHEDFETAAELFQRVLADHSETEWEIFAYDRLGRCYEAQEKWAQAVQVYRPAIKKLSAYTGVAVTPARIGELKRRLLSSYQNMQDHQSIIDLYQEMLAENPATPSAPEDQFQLAQACFDMGNQKAAAENFALVVERYPASPYALRVQGQQADLLTHQLEYDWTSFDTFQAAQGLSRTEQYDEALSRFDRVIEARPDAPMAYAAAFQKYIVQYRQSGDATALREELDSSRDEYPYGLGGVAVGQLRDILQGICQAQATLAVNPQDAGACQQMGLGYYRTQAYQCGIDAYKQAIAIVPEAPDAYNMLGYCCIGAQKYEQAVSAFQQLVVVAPDDPNSYDSLAEGYYLVGDTTAAIQLYQKSLAIDSTFTNPHYMLGTIYRELGQNDKAVEHLEKYLQLDPNGYQSQNAHDQLEQLRSPSSNESAP